MVDVISSHGRTAQEALTRSGLADRDLQSLNETDLSILNQIHFGFARIASGDEVVMASKYLHFMYPRLFPIRDSIVATLIRSWQGDVRQYSRLLAWYFKSLNSEWTASLRSLPKGEGVVTPVRTLDSVMWLIGNAGVWKEAAVAARKPEINREVDLFFNANPQIVLTLLDQPEGQSTT
jgi:hypothetical protein